MTVLRQSFLHALDALLILYWLVFVGAGVSEWMIGTQRLFSPVLFSLLHWGMFLCLALRSLHGFRRQWLSREAPSLWQIGISVLLILAILDGVLRSDLTQPAVKSNIMGCLLIGFFTLSFRNSAAVRVMAIAAATIVTIQIAMLTFELFNDRFLSADYGRAAGLLVNPNVAGSALALMGLISSRFLPQYLVPGFLIFVGFGVVLTLSRSSIIAYGIGVALLVGWTIARGQAERMLAGWGLSVGVLVSCALVVVFALQGEGRFKYAVADRVSGIYKLVTGEDLRQIESEVGNLLSRPLDQRHPSAEKSDPTHYRQQDDVGSGSVQKSFKSGVPPGEDIEELILAEARELNSALTRQMLFERGVNTFLGSPLLGIGASRSFELAPHNSFLHAANSFGVSGLIGLLVFLSGYFRRGSPDGYRIVFGISLVVVMFFLHGAMTNNPIIISIAASMVLLRETGGVRREADGSDGVCTSRA